MLVTHKSPKHTVKNILFWEKHRSRHRREEEYNISHAQLWSWKTRIRHAQFFAPPGPPLAAAYAEMHGRPGQAYMFMGKLGEITVGKTFGLQVFNVYGHI